MNSRRRVQVFRTAIGFSNASDCLYEVSAADGRYLVIHSIETEINGKTRCRHGKPAKRAIFVEQIQIITE